MLGIVKIGMSELNQSEAGAGSGNVVATVAPATTSSTAVVVVQAPLSARFPVPAALAVTSNGLVVSSPLYSSTRTSGACAAWLNVTVIWLGVPPSPTIFLA